MGGEHPRPFAWGALGRGGQGGWHKFGRLLRRLSAPRNDPYFYISRKIGARLSLAPLWVAGTTGCPGGVSRKRFRREATMGAGEVRPGSIAVDPYPPVAARDLRERARPGRRTASPDPYTPSRGRPARSGCGRNKFGRLLRRLSAPRNDPYFYISRKIGARLSLAPLWVAGTTGCPGGVSRKRFRREATMGAGEVRPGSIAVDPYPPVAARDLRERARPGRRTASPDPYTPSRGHPARPVYGSPGTGQTNTRMPRHPAETSRPDLEGDRVG